MNAHLSDSDRQALRLAQDLREEMRAALPQLPSAPAVSPYVDQAGGPSVLLRMDAVTAHALMALLAERRMEWGATPSAEPRQADGSSVPRSVPAPSTPQAVPAAQGPVVATVPPFGAPAYAEPPRQASYAESSFVPPRQGDPVFPGGTEPTPLVPYFHPTR